MIRADAADLPTAHAAPRALAYPPGGLLVWIFILMELCVFLAGLIGVLWLRADDPQAHAIGRAQLSAGLATLNTVLLLTSGYLAALAAHRAEAGAGRAAARLLGGAIALGVAFLGVKGVEYADKLAAGLAPGTSTFLDLYWGLTAFHALHVVFGLPLLAWAALRVRRPDATFEPDLNLHTATAYWHMCDLVWILVFPTLYLL